MFGVIKLMFLLVLAGLGFFIYDYFSHLRPAERALVKKEMVNLIDTGEFGQFSSSLGEKMSDDFTNRFWPKVKKKATKCLGKSEEEPCEPSK